MSLKRDLFPKDFSFGTATSSYQIEGAYNTDGKQPSIWDTFCEKQGKIKDGSSGKVACDHYHLYKDDIALIKQTGFDSYRFSISWPRVISNRTGKINPAGLDFYDRLTDSMLEKDIDPFLTLYHWDLPEYWQEKGGWANRDTAKGFAEYACIMADRLGDRIDYWMTHNEMWCTAFLGNAMGAFAPGIKDHRIALATAHNVLLSHGLALEGMRQINSRIKIGIAPNYLPSLPATESVDDKKAASNFDGFFNRWFLDPLSGRGYPADIVQLYGDMMPEIQPGDMKKIAGEMDFIGVNYYNTNWYKWNPDLKPLFAEKDNPSNLWKTEDRDVYAPGLLDTLRRFHKDYGFENIYITENGAACKDQLTVDENGTKRIHDDKRVRFLEEHFEQAALALKEGIPLKGFFVWSLMDNFEWAAGYTLRYGIHYVDFETQERIPKDSALWLKEFLTS